MSVDKRGGQDGDRNRDIVNAPPSDVTTSRSAMKQVRKTRAERAYDIGADKAGTHHEPIHAWGIRMFVKSLYGPRCESSCRD
eukprot:scaffold101432_cov33-Tisochrysis_lutea.AAC.4